MTEHYFVTGGAGCIGSELCCALLERGHRVTAFDNLSTGSEDHISAVRGHPAFRFIHADLLDEDRLNESLGGVSFVYHLAANSDVKFSEDAPDRDLRQNTIATAHLLDAMRRHEIGKLAFSSTSAVYGISPLQPIPESQPCRPISLYGATKLGCEALISAHAHLFGLQAWVFRFANVVGGKVRKSGRTVVSDFIAKLSADPTRLEILGDGRQQKSYILVSECVDAMLHAVAKARNGYNVLNLGGTTATNVTRIAELVVEAMGLVDVEFAYTGGEAGWPGDVPKFMLDVDALSQLGWRAQVTSEDAIRFAISELLGIQAQ
jgi:UDP-glucose 4-epimerase